MQLPDESVYCIICQQLVPRGKSQRVFKTGFYKREFPLAQCVDCMQKNGINGAAQE
jgi:hypothetical protein